MQCKPQIVILHPNSLCCLAMRTILTDIAPFMGAMSEVDILSYNSMEEFEAESKDFVVHYFVAADILQANIDFFLPLARRCIVLTEGNGFDNPEFHTVNLHQPEREVLKGVLMMHRTAHTSAMQHPHPTRPSDEGELLSEREKEVLALIIKGFINKEIADKLSISTPTVIFHRRNIMEKIGSKSIGRLTIYAVMNGIVDAKEL